MTLNEAKNMILDSAMILPGNRIDAAHMVEGRLKNGEGVRTNEDIWIETFTFN